VYNMPWEFVLHGERQDCTPSGHPRKEGWTPRLPAAFRALCLWSLWHQKLYVCSHRIGTGRTCQSPSSRNHGATGLDWLFVQVARSDAARAWLSSSSSAIWKTRERL
jgi:hypothetical protein